MSVIKPGKKLLQAAAKSLRSRKEFGIFERQKRKIWRLRVEEKERKREGKEKEERREI